MHGKNLFYFWSHDDAIAAMDLRAAAAEEAPSSAEDIVVLHGAPY